MAGVSESTASFVLTKKADSIRISEETQLRVLEAANQLNYVPSLLHRSVRSGKTGIISFYNAFRNRDPADLYMDRVSSAIEHAGGTWRYNILVHCDFELTVDETYKFLNGGFSDGVILFSPEVGDPLLARLRTSDLPTVILNPREEEPVLSTIREDGDDGARLIASELVRLGHRRIGVLVQMTPGWPAPQVREAQFRTAIRELVGHDHDVKTVVTCNDFIKDLHALMQPPTPTAIFVWNDRTAYNVLDAAAEFGLNVPEDVSIVAYDGIHWPSATNKVITSVHAPFDALANATLETLHAAISGAPGPIHVRVPHQIVPGVTLAVPRS